VARDNAPPSRGRPLLTGATLKTLIFLALAAAVIIFVRKLVFGAAQRAKRDSSNDSRAAAPRANSPKALPPPEAPSSAAPFEAPVTAESPIPDLSSALTPDQVFMKLHALALGAQELPALDSPIESPRREAWLEAFGPLLESIATEPKYSPRRPLLLPQLLRAVNDSEVSRREIANIISQDPALAGNLLKLANSSLYRVSGQAIESVDRAVALLGTDGIRSLIAAALIQPVFRSERTEFPHFAEIAWEHTFRSAAAAESHAAVIENTDPFAAQLLGLVMGLGGLIVFRVALDQYLEHRQRPDPAVLAHLLEQHAARTARQVAASWDLSERVLAALEEQSPLSAGLPGTPLGRSLRFGRLLGALALLNANERIDDEGAKLAILATGASLNQFDRFWTRLTGRPSVLEPKPHRPPSTLAG
jgi:HD-like signal output (HDOD) protein